MSIPMIVESQESSHQFNSNVETHSNTFSHQKNFVIVIPSYNNEAYCEANLLSVFCQTYPHYRIIYIDDASSDNTFSKVQSLIQQQGKQDRVHLIRNANRCLAMENLYYAIHSCEDHEIVVSLDGDDWLYDSSVLETLNIEYSKYDVWLTYGSYISHPDNKRGVHADCIPHGVLKNNTIRKKSRKHWMLSHLRTFYAKLFKKIRLEDLKYGGVFLPSAYDFAMMIPMVEMAGTHARFIQKILYVYNRSTPINDDKVRAAIQEECKNHILSLFPYQPLSELFR